MPLSLTLYRKQTLFAEIDKEKLAEAINEWTKREKAWSNEKLLDFLQDKLRIEINNYDSTGVHVGLVADQCIRFYRKNKTTSSGL